MLIAGVFYSSWPLGYWLNPGADRGLASNLEAARQPYNWVFIGMDMLCGALIIGGTWWLLHFIRRHKKHADRYLVESAAIGLGIFGILTAIDALLPLNCVQSEQQCLPPLQNPNFIIHGLASIGSIAGLTLSIVVIWWLAARDPRVISVTRWLLHLFLFVWFCFGIGTAFLVFRDRSSTFWQHIFILICSFWIIALPYYIWEVLRIRPHLHEPLEPPNTLGYGRGEHR